MFKKTLKVFAKAQFGTYFVIYIEENHMAIE